MMSPHKNNVTRSGRRIECVLCLSSQRVLASGVSRREVDGDELLDGGFAREVTGLARREVPTLGGPFLEREGQARDLVVEDHRGDAKGVLVEEDAAWKVEGLEISEVERDRRPGGEQSEWRRTAKRRAPETA
jgi:hypothetical protein